MQTFPSLIMAQWWPRSCLCGVRLTLTRQTWGRGILTILAPLVMVMNVMIWTV